MSRQCHAIASRSPLRLVAALALVCGPAWTAAASPISVLDLDITQLAQGSGVDGAGDVRRAAPRAPAGRISVVADLDKLNSNGRVSANTRVASSAGTAATLRSDALDGSDSATGGESGTLREVLHSIVAWRQSDQSSAPSAPAGPVSARARDGGDPNADPGVDLRQLVLNSQLAGKLMQAVVDIKTVDASGATFSILGLGNFAIDVMPDLHAAIVSELSSGLAFRVSLSSERLGYDHYPETALTGGALAGMPHENINLIRVAWKWILDMLYSPIGALLSMSAVITVVLWLCVKSVVFLQRRAGRY